MRGPYRIEWLEYYIQEETPGVFLCSNDGEVVSEIGWSDKDTKEAIRNICLSNRGADNKFSYFWFQSAGSAKEAFLLYCQLWHKYNRNGPLSAHPEPPSELGDLKCPVVDCEWNEKRRGLKEEFI